LGDRLLRSGLGRLLLDLLLGRALVLVLDLLALDLLIGDLGVAVAPRLQLSQLVVVELTR
jgi:hypothetical protein